MEGSTHERSQAALDIALLPPPRLLTHLIPFIELAKKLVIQHNCTVSLIIPDDGSSMEPQKSILKGLPDKINTIFLPPVSTDDFPDDVRAEVLVPACVIRSLPSLRDVLTPLKTKGKLSALVVDLFAPHAIDVAKQLNIPAYIFYIVAANDLLLSLDLPELDKSCTTEYKDSPDPVKLSGSIALSPEDLPDPMKERNSEVYKWVLDVCNRFLLADGILVNSFLELEREAFKELERRRLEVPPVYPVGPLISTGQSDKGSDHDECVKWLDNQPPKSVLFVSFGSAGTLSEEQFNELAFGLEMSQQRFLWVVRRPQQNAAAAYLNDRSKIVKNPLDFLPEGFVERTRDRGFVVASWAPQVRVLSHSSTGGFVTHCGWNSILESMVFGVPMIAWPLCFDQKMNAVFLTEGLKAAVRVKENENGIVERGSISELVKGVMGGEEGEIIAQRMIDFKVAAGNVLSHEGSSTQALAQVVEKWTSRK